MEMLGEKLKGMLDMQYIENIYIICSRNYFINEFSFRGEVTFMKDNSTFSQKFEGIDIADVYNQIYDFCKSLK